MTFAELAALIREQDAQADRLKGILRERLLALSPPAPPQENVAPVSPDAVAPALDGDASQGKQPDSVSRPVAPRTFRLEPKPMAGKDVKAFQHDLNRRLRAWGKKQRVKEDGVYGPATRLVARRVLRSLGFDQEELRHGITPGMRRVIRKVRPPAQSPRPHAESTRPTAPVKPPRPSTPPAGSVQAAIRKHGGRYEDIIVRAAKEHRLPISLVCAVLDKESDFRNVYGADNGRNPNPIRSRPGAALAVTEDNYRTYRKHLKAGKDANGVGPMQLTHPAFQERADKLGGCWKVGPNIRIGCAVLRENIDRHGSLREGVRAYNGSGQAARNYAASVLELQTTWAQILSGKHVAPPTQTRPPTTKPPMATLPVGTREPRTFKLKGSMHGEDVRLWQIALRRQFNTWKVDYPLAADGHYGPVTRSATRDALKGLGIAQESMRDGITPQLRRKVRHKHLTPAEKVRYRARAAWRRKLRKKFAGTGVAPPLNKILTSSNGWTGKAGHDGVDLICHPNVPIMAICDAEVIDVRAGGWWGKNPTGDIAKGDGIIQLKCVKDVGPFKRGMHIGYGHAEHAVVHKGQKVKAGEVIGKAGLANKAWHIHFMVNGGSNMQGRRRPRPDAVRQLRHEEAIGRHHRRPGGAPVTARRAQPRAVASHSNAD